MQFDIGNLLAVLLGGLLVFAAQWFASRQSAKTEAQKWKQEEIREVRKDIVRFREERTRPVFEALDRLAENWDFDSTFDLAEAIGYEGEHVDRESEEYKQKLKEMRRKRFEQLQKDISSASRIHEPETRRAVAKLLWAGTTPDDILPEGTASLEEVSIKLENWIFNPKLGYNSVQHNQRRD
jgi:hypothetical protein